MNPFSISIYKCKDDSCIECLTFNKEQWRGICTKCADKFKLVDEECISDEQNIANQTLQSIATIT